jgi:undecaprenyl-diphosphatase
MCACVPLVTRTWDIDDLGYGEAVGIGFGQSPALLAGMHRDWVCMTAGLLHGLNNQDAARFAFLLATPIIAAGVFEVSDLIGPLGNGIRLQALGAAVCAAIAAVVSVPRIS